MNQTSDEMGYDGILVKKFSYDEQTYMENIGIIEIVMKVYFGKDDWRSLRNKKLPDWNKTK